MKRRMLLLLALPFAIGACNNEGKDSVEKADSLNTAKTDSATQHPVITTDEESTTFLVHAANGGMAEVQLGELASQKAVNAKVKDFGKMMVNDHSMANDKVKTLAAQRNVTLPDSVGNEKKKELDDMMMKKGTDFDKAFMKKMVNDHETTIDMFSQASDKVNDPEVKTFIDNTLPKLKMHLDSAKAIQKMIK
ncbi:MAG: DUF4142 domain-containing protein [Chitinophagaceae bacterium]